MEDLHHGKSAFYGENGTGEELCASDLTKRNGWSAVGLSLSRDHALSWRLDPAFWCIGKLYRVPRYMTVLTFVRPDHSRYRAVVLY